MVFEYRPASFAIGLTISGASLLAVLVLIVVRVVTRCRRVPTLGVG